MNQPHTELEIRERLGVPADAERVLILAESSHWDPNWLHTSEVYYERFVERILDQAVQALEEQPRRVYTLESVFFLRMYWDRRPEQRERITALFKDRRLRLSSPAVSTADTIIPSPEAILRDFLIGQEWLRANGLESDSKLAYFPDSFGASPALPSMLQAAGFSHTAITRVDGMYFPGFEFNFLGRYPRRGSTAELLMKVEHTLDFVWRDRSGAKVLCHWNAFSYFQGDLLAHRGLSRIYLLPLAITDRSEVNIARRIRRFAWQLGPLSRTPYMFCPIGVDFISPIPDMVSLLDRYNRVRYPKTGIWVVNAGLDDYLELVESHREQLPEIELDPNPYWSGFYAARPKLKDRCHELLERLLLVDRLTFLPENMPAAQSVGQELQSAHWTAAVANHHDFITGTSPDPTVEQEQLPWLAAANAAVRSAINRLTIGNGRGANGFHPANQNGRLHSPVARAANPRPGRSPSAGRMPRWSRDGDRLQIETDDYRIELDAAAGGAIVSATDPTGGEPLLTGPSNDLVSYHGSGGLWRMGHEIEGGAWKAHRRASDQAVELQVEEQPEGLQVSWFSELDGERILRSARFAADCALIRFRVTGCAPKHRTITVSFATDLLTDQLTMDVPGGVIDRPAAKLRVPTFWPFQHFLHVVGSAGRRGLAVFQRRPGAASYKPAQSLELVALRNATRERAYRWFPVSGHPAAGFEQDSYTYEYALAFTQDGGWDQNALPATAVALMQNGWGGPLTEAVLQRTAGMIALDRPDVWITANKPASRGDGRVVRLYTHTAQGQPVTLTVEPHVLRGATLCDARERDLRPLKVQDGSVQLTMPGSIATLRLIL